jgi:alpha-N-acetylglucosamine transferase
MPTVNFVAEQIKAPVNHTTRDLNYMYNGVKLRLWVEFLKKTNDNVIFADCDMIAVKNGEHAFDIPFDVAYTERTRIKRIIMNGGIMMARPTEKAIAFFEEMLEINDRMFKNPAFHKVWHNRYAGMNQSAFGYCHERGKTGALIHKYKTIEWNAVDCDWQSINSKTVFIHVKSMMRKMVLGEKPVRAKYSRIVKLWRDMFEKTCNKPFSKSGVAQ